MPEIAQSYAVGSAGLLWLQAAVLATAWLRPNYPREPTFATELPLFWIFVGCTFRYGLSRWRCRWSVGDPTRTYCGVNGDPAGPPSYASDSFYRPLGVYQIGKVEVRSSDSSVPHFKLSQA